MMALPIASTGDYPIYKHRERRDPARDAFRIEGNQERRDEDRSGEYYSWSSVGLCSAPRGCVSLPRYLTTYPSDNSYGGWVIGIAKKAVMKDNGSYDVMSIDKADAWDIDVGLGEGTYKYHVQHSEGEDRLSLLVGGHAL